MKPIDQRNDPSEFLSQPEFLRRLATALRKNKDVMALVPQVSIRLRAIADIIEMAQCIVKDKHGTDQSESRPEPTA